MKLTHVYIKYKWMCGCECNWLTFGCTINKQLIVHIPLKEVEEKLHQENFSPGCHEQNEEIAQQITHLTQREEGMEKVDHHNVLLKEV